MKQDWAYCICFESLSPTGVIIPRPNSPVHRAIFLVEKIHDKGHLTERLSVQDLQAINKAVQECTPNRCTILLQGPVSVKWFSVVLANAFFF